MAAESMPSDRHVGADEFASNDAVRFMRAEQYAAARVAKHYDRCVRKHDTARGGDARATAPT